MSHGHRTPKHYGSKVSLARVDPAVHTMRVGSPEHIEHLEAVARQYTVEIKADFDNLQGNWTREAWSEKCNILGENLRKNLIRNALANKDTSK